MNFCEEITFIRFLLKFFKVIRWAPSSVFSLCSRHPRCCDVASSCQTCRGLKIFPQNSSLGEDPIWSPNTHTTAYRGGMWKLVENPKNKTKTIKISNPDYYHLIVLSKILLGHDGGCAQTTRQIERRCRRSFVAEAGDRSQFLAILPESSTEST